MTKQRRFLIAGNWKMHGSRQMVTELLEVFKANIPTEFLESEMAVFPPYVFLEQVQKSLVGSSIRWGAQNVALANQGAYTGEVSASMLVELGCQYVLIGHSERRSLFGESDTDVAKKFILAQQAGLIPIVCVGETLAERDQDRTLAVVGRQLQAILATITGIETPVKDFILAYEPVWAIGTGLTASPEQAQTVHAALRKQVAEHSQTLAEQLRILYGGSVKKTSARALFAMPDIDGGLVGGASLDAQEFLQIYNSVCNNYS